MNIKKSGLENQMKIMQLSEANDKKNQSRSAATIISKSSKVGKKKNKLWYSESVIMFC